MAIADSRIVHSRLHVLRSDDMTVVDISDWVSRVEIELGDVSGVGTGATGGDGVVRQMRFRVHNQTGADRFSPLDTSSSWNDVGGSYEPLLWPNRQALLYVAVQDAGDPAPSFPSEYDLLFHGYIGDEIRTSGSFVECQLRDLAKRLQDTFIENPKTYYPGSFVPVQTVMQEIIDDNVLVDPPQIYIPMSITPDRDVKAYHTEWQSVWDALQDLAAQTALWLGYKYDPGTGSFRLTLIDPPRNKNTPDFQLSWTDDFYLHELDITDRNVRNVVVVEFRRDEDGQRVRVTKTDATSIAEFGRRAMQIEEGSTSIIKTTAAAERFAEAAIADLSDLTSTVRIDMPLFPAMDVFAGLEVTDPQVMSAPRFYGVESVRHVLDFDGGRFRTSVVCSGRVIGAHKRWLLMQARPGSTGDPTGNDYPVRTNTVLTVAASDAPEEVKRRADIVCDGIDDHLDIQAAIDRATNTGIGKVALTEGTFHVAAPIELPSNTVLQGQGPVTILRVVDNADDSILTNVLVNDDPLSGNVDITIADLAIDGNKANQPPGGFKHGISLTFVENATIQRVVIRNMEQNGIALWDFCEEGLIEGCVIHDNDGSGMHLFSCFDMSVTGNQILRNGGDGILLLFGGSYTVVSNTILQNGSVGINITSESNSITGNTVEMNGSYGINLSAVQARNNTVSSNTVTRNGWYGIILSGGAHDNVVADNNIEQNGTDSANTYDNIFVVGGAEDNDIQGNVCRNGLTGQVRYGIAVDATAGDRNLVTNNDLLNSGVSGDLFIGNPTTITEAGNRLTFGSATSIAFRWMHSTDQVIAAGTNVLQWDTEIVDTAGVHSGAAETEYTVPINGIWHFLASIRIKELANSFSVSYRFRIKVNANTIVEQYVSGIFTTDNFPHSMECSGIWECAAGDLVTVELERIGGNTQDVVSVSSITPLFMGYKIR